MSLTDPFIFHYYCIFSRSATQELATVAKTVLCYTLNIISQIVLLILPQVSFNINDVEPLWYKLYLKKNYGSNDNSMTLFTIFFSRTRLTQDAVIKVFRISFKDYCESLIRSTMANNASKVKS